MRRLFRLQLGAYALHIEMGRRLRMALVARICPLCPSMHVGDEMHYVFECPAFEDIRRCFHHLFDDSHGAMRCLVGQQLHQSRLVGEGSLQQACDALGDTLVETARQFGCCMSNSCEPSRSANRRPPDKPRFDDECREMRAEFRRVMKMDPN